jgi:hypothetical protein
MYGRFGGGRLLCLEVGGWWSTDGGRPRTMSTVGGRRFFETGRCFLGRGRTNTCRRGASSIERGRCWLDTFEEGEARFRRKMLVGKGDVTRMYDCEGGNTRPEKGARPGDIFFLKVGGLRMLELLPGYLFGERGWHTVEER